MPNSLILAKIRRYFRKGKKDKIENNTVSIVKNAQTLSEKKIRAALECDIHGYCLGHVSPPIFQCLNGHLLCSKCTWNLKSCAICRVDITVRARNLLLEKLAADLIFDCGYSGVGCGVKVKFADKSAHEYQCEFGYVRCPFPDWVGCDWRRGMGDVMRHLETHEWIEFVENGNEREIELKDGKGNTISASIKSLRSHHFLHVSLYMYENGVFSHELQYVQIIDDEDQMFEYSLVVMHSNQIIQTFESRVRSIRVPLEDITRDCSRIDRDAFNLKITRPFILETILTIFRHQI